MGDLPPAAAARAASTLSTLMGFGAVAARRAATPATPPTAISAAFSSTHVTIENCSACAFLAFISPRAFADHPPADPVVRTGLPTGGSARKAGCVTPPSASGAAATVARLEVATGWGGAATGFSAGASLGRRLKRLNKPSPLDLELARSSSRAAGAGARGAVAPLADRARRVISGSSIAALVVASSAAVAGDGGTADSASTTQTVAVIRRDVSECDGTGQLSGVRCPSRIPREHATDIRVCLLRA